MPISPAGSKLTRDREAGFTLVELMIVITIIGLASAAAVLAIPDPRGRLIDEAERFAARTRVAQQSAIVEGRSVSVWVSGGGYGFDRRAQGQWQSISEKPMTVSRWGSGIRPVLTGDRDRVVFDSTGLADRSMDVKLMRDGDSATVRIGNDGLVKLGG